MSEELKYKTLKEFKASYPKEVVSLSNRGLLRKFCEDMGWGLKNLKPRGYWNYDTCKEEALKHKFIKDWRNESPFSCDLSKKKGWFDELTKHMIRPNKHKGYWTKERCLEVALKCKTRKEWYLISKTSIKEAKLYGWYDECTAHMVLLTKPSGYWTKERCMEEALKHKTRKSWRKGSGNSSYGIAFKNGWVKECMSHIVEIKKPAGYWTKELCLKEALTHEMKERWRDLNTPSYAAAMEHGWFEECTAHMNNSNKPNGYWGVKERCMEESLKYKTRNEWYKVSAASYRSAKKNGWVDECTTHMGDSRKPNGYWTKELCLLEALKYKTKVEWSKISTSSYNTARINGWFDECNKHMVQTNSLPRGYWTKEHCLEEALKYKKRSEWAKNSPSSLSAAKKNGWVDECTTHMG